MTNVNHPDVWVGEAVPVLHRDTGLVGSMLYQADRDNLLPGHPLRTAALDMDAAIRAWAACPNDRILTAAMRAQYAKCQLVWTQYWENRHDNTEANIKKQHAIKQRKLAALPYLT